MAQVVIPRSCKICPTLTTTRTLDTTSLRLAQDGKSVTQTTPAAIKQQCYGAQSSTQHLAGF